MATYYWVGGAGTWNTTSTTNWSLTSGGTGGAGVPTLADDVIFDTNSDTGVGYIVTVTSGTCRNWTATAQFFCSFQGGVSGTVTCSGSASVAATGVSTLISMTFNSSTANTLQLRTQDIDYINFIGTGSWTMLSGLFSDFTINVYGGTLDMNGFAMTCGTGFSSTGTSTRLIKLGTSASHFVNGAVTITGSNVTVDPGTSTLLVNANALVITAPSMSFWNITTQNAGTTTVDIGSCNNLTINGGSKTTFPTTSPVVVSGTLNLNGNASQNVRASVSGQVNANAITNISNIDFYGATITGAAAPISGTNLGDAGNNTGIASFATPKTVYVVGASDSSTTAFALTSGGTGTITAWPLPQDTIIINNSSAGSTFQFYPSYFYYRGTLDASARTTAYTINLTTSAYFVGNVTLSSAITVNSTSPSFNFYGYSNQTFTPNSATLGCNLGVNKPSGTLTAGGAITTTTAATKSFTVTGAFNTNNFAVSVGSLTTSGTASIDIGTTALSLTGNATTIYSVTATTTFTGTKNINATYSGATGTRTFSGSLTEAASPNLNITAGTDAVSISSGTFNNLNTTGHGGYSGTFSPTLYGNLTLGAAHNVAGGVITFGATSGTKTITTNGRPLYAADFNGIGGSWQLQDDATFANQLTLTNGNLDLNSKTVSALTFSSSNSNTRALLFGASGVLNLTSTANATVWTTSTSTNLTLSGSVDVRATGNATGVTRIFTSGSFSESSAPNLKITAGSDSFNIAGNFRDVDTTGFSGTLGNTIRILFGSLTIGSTTIVGAGFNTTTFASTTGTKFINPNGTVLDFPMIFNGLGGTWAALGNLNLNTKYITLTAGTLNLNGYNLAVATISTSGSSVRGLSIGTGTITISGSGTGAWNFSASTNLTITHSAGAKISMTSASAKTFAGGGRSYPTLEQAGTGTLTISGSNTFANITNTVQPTIVTFTSGTTQTFAAFNLRGTAGNLVTLAPSTTSNYALSAPSGLIVDVDYLSISRSTATGGAAWYAGSNSTNGGNNTGWIFTATPTIAFTTGVTATGAVGSVTVGQGVGAFPTSVTGTGATGNETVITGGTAFPTGVVGTTALGTAIAEVAVIVSGVQATASLNSVILFTSNFITANGVQGTTQLGQEAAAISIVASPTGVQASALVNSVSSVLGSAVVSASKVTGTSAVGFVSIDADGGVGVVGNVGTAVLGNETVLAGANVYPTGVSAQVYLGTSSETGSTNVSTTGVFATGQTGTLTTTTVNIFPVTGVLGTGNVGTVNLRADQILSVSGVYGTTFLGTANTFNVTNVNLTTVYADGYVGNITQTGTGEVYPLGVQGNTILGETAVWITVNDAQTNNWNAVQTLQI